MSNVHANLGLAGYFKLDVVSADAEGNPIPGTERSSGWFQNLITNTGMDMLGGADWIRRCFIGTGNTEPQFTDTALAAQTAFANGGTSNGPVDNTEKWTSLIGTYVFAQGAVVGNMQEIGIGNTSNQLFSRALIRDGAGNPTTLTVTAIDILTVTYQLRLYRPADDIVTTITNSGVTYTVTSRTARQMTGASLGDWESYGSPFSAYPRQMYTYSGNIGTVDGAPASQSGSRTESTTEEAYVPGTYYRQATFNFSTTEGNAAGGIRSVINGVNGPEPVFVQAQFDPPIAKDSTKTLAITMRISWARHTP